MARFVIAIALAGLIGGCGPGEVQKPAKLAPGKTRLTVDFQKGQTLRYRFVSSRNVDLNWGQMTGGPESGKDKIDKMTESFEAVVSYTAAEVDPYGVATIQAKCESASVKRAGESSRQASRTDAAQTLAGKVWVLTVGPTGKLEDRSKLLDVIRQAGQRAFRSDRSQGLVKEPDLIYDFIATQWFMWDSISSIPNPLAGVGVGDQWQSLLPVPSSMFLFVARDVNYRVDEIKDTPEGKVAVIGSTYGLKRPSPSDWPVPYTEPFQMSGTFGFLRGYNTTDLQGQGQELFNLDAGRSDRYSQNYTLHVEASLPLGLGINPKLTIVQNLTMELLQPPAAAVPK